jgi:chromosome segregation ATPase
MGEDAAPSATPSISEALSDLKSDLTTKLAELKQAQDKVAEETHKASALQDEVKLLQAKLMDVQRTVNNYEPLSTAMRIRLKEARKLTSQKADIAEAAIDKEEKLIIDKKTVEFEQALSDQVKMVQYEHSVAEAAKKAANSAEAVLLHKQTQYAD